MENNQNNNDNQSKQIPSKRRKGLRIFCFTLALLAAFIMGWRVMPSVWPGIKETLVYPLFPQIKPASPSPSPTAEPYEPESRAKVTLDTKITVTDSLIYYFYKDYCPWCRQLAPLIAGLPAQITVADGTRSSVRLICLNKTEDESLRLIEKYYDTFNIPEEKQKVPSMVIGDRYLFGGDEIGEWLIASLIAGDGLQTPLLNGSERVP